MKKIPKKLIKETEKMVKMLLHASRDCMRNTGINSLESGFVVSDGWYAEAFGVMRGLYLCGYGYLDKSINLNGKDNFEQDEHDLNWWFNKLCEDVLNEEGFYSDNRCEYCREKYKKDDSIHYKLKKKVS